MKKMILLIAISAFTACGPPAYKYEPPEQDPLIESIEYWRKADCLRNCSDRELWEERKCD